MKTSKAFFNSVAEPAPGAEQGDPSSHGFGPNLGTDRREMAILVFFVEKWYATGPPALSQSGHYKGQVCVDELVERIEQVCGIDVKCVDEQSRIFASCSAAFHMVGNRHADKEKRQAPAPAELRDLVEPEFALGPVTVSVYHFAGDSKVVGEVAHNDEVRPEAIGKGE